MPRELRGPRLDLVAKGDDCQQDHYRNRRDDDSVLNGGSTHYGLGAVVEEARQWGVTRLPPCVLHSTDRYVVEDAAELAVSAAGAVRVPLTAIRGLSPGAARHIMLARKAFGGFDSLLDFCRKVDRTVVTRQDLLLLVKLGAFAWTGLSRGQLAFAEQYYAGAADLLRAADRDPSGAPSIEADFAGGSVPALDVEDWPPEVTAARSNTAQREASAVLGAGWRRRPDGCRVGRGRLSVLPT